MAEFDEVDGAFVVEVQGVKDYLEVIQFELDAHLFEGHHELLEIEVASEVLVDRAEGLPEITVLLLDARVNGPHDLLEPVIHQLGELRQGSSILARLTQVSHA